MRKNSLTNLKIIKQTVDLQGFRVHTATKDPDGLIAGIRPNTRHRIRYGTCGRPAVYRAMRDARFFRHVLSDDLEILHTVNLGADTGVETL